MGRVGHEHPPLTAPKTAISTEGGAKSDALNGDFSQNDADLAAIVRAWPTLPPDVKKQIIALAQSALAPGGPQK
jgi:hypothetical protein